MFTNKKKSGKEEIRTNFVINFKLWHHPINVKRCVHNCTADSESFVLIVSQLLFLGWKNLEGSF